MFGNGMFKKTIASLLVATLIGQTLPALAASSGGGAEQPAMVKLVPLELSVDTTGVPAKLVESESEAVWRLFDRDTTTTYQPSRTVRLTVTLAEASAIKRLRVFGTPSYLLNVYRSSGSTWEAIPSLCNIDLQQGRASAWNNVPAGDENSATATFLLEFVPQGNVTTPLSEIELWGERLTATADLALTLEGVASPQDLSAISAGRAQFKSFPFAPTELSLPAEGGEVEATVTLSQHPATFKRAYLAYDGYNAPRSISLKKSINGGSWNGGIATSDGSAATWQGVVEEINPACQPCRSTTWQMAIRPPPGPSVRQGKTRSFRWTLTARWNRRACGFIWFPLHASWRPCST
jgi:hypothetical protein